MAGECHGHVFMDGIDYKAAAKRHDTARPDKAAVEKCLLIYSSRGVTFFRDGGDHYGASLYAKAVAPSFGIDYRTPVFAIHREGYYGAIVGRAYTTKEGFLSLVNEAVSLGCDFIKIMISGILDYDCYGRLSCPSLDAAEIAFLIATVHDAGRAVMVHANGDEACKCAIKSGADSIEHGFFMSRDTLSALADSSAVWTPTLSPSALAIGSGRFDDDVLLRITDAQSAAVAFALSRGAVIAAGSDAGAFKVTHDIGIESEVSLLKKCGAAESSLAYAEQLIKERFRPRR